MRTYRAHTVCVMFMNKASLYVIAVQYLGGKERLLLYFTVLREPAPALLAAAGETEKAQLVPFLGTRSRFHISGVMLALFEHFDVNRALSIFRML